MTSTRRDRDGSPASDLTGSSQLRISRIGRDVRVIREGGRAPRPGAEEGESWADAERDADDRRREQDESEQPPGEGVRASEISLRN